MGDELSFRDRLVARIQEQPGTNTSELAALFGMDASTADYHLRRLAKDELVVCESVGRSRCWFPARGYCPVLRKSIPILREVEARAVAFELDDLPRSAARLAAQADVSAGRARWVAFRLEEAGIVARTSNGRAMLCEGAAHCVGRAAEAAPCERWGVCPVSRRLISFPTLSATTSGRDRSVGRPRVL